MIVQIKSSNGTTTYDVNILEMSCTCPHYLYRMKAMGGVCKHIKQALDQASVTTEHKTEEALDFLETNTNAVDFVDKFGEDLLNHFKRVGQVLEQNNKIIKVK